MNQNNNLPMGLNNNLLMDLNNHHVSFQIIKFDTRGRFLSFSALGNKINKSDPSIKFIIILSGLTEKIIINRTASTFNSIINSIRELNLITTNNLNLSRSMLNLIYDFKQKVWGTNSSNTEIIVHGETLVSLILSNYLNINGISSHIVNPFDLPESFEQISARTIIIPGFIGEFSEVFGSQLAVQLGSSLSHYEFWTDTNGFFNGDTQTIIPQLNWKIAIEFATSNPKIINPLSIRLCGDKNIPIYIKNIYDPDGISTVITSSDQNLLDRPIIQIITDMYAIKLAPGSINELPPMDNPIVINNRMFTYYLDRVSNLNYDNINPELEIIKPVSCVCIWSENIPEIFNRIQLLDIEIHIFNKTSKSITLVIDESKTHLLTKNRIY
jgi:aspartokinase